MNTRLLLGKPIQNTRVERPVSSRIFSWMAVVTLIGVFLGSALVISAFQHFESINLGYKTEHFRQQSKELTDNVRKLELERSRIGSPVELERRAKAIGMKRPGTKLNSIRRPALGGH